MHIYLVIMNHILTSFNRVGRASTVSISIKYNLRQSYPFEDNLNGEMHITRGGVYFVTYLNSRFIWGVVFRDSTALGELPQTAADSENS